MNRDNARISEALHDCLERMDRGADADTCLAAYPDLAAELAPLLRLALQTRSAAEEMTPSPEAQRVGLGRIADAWATLQERRHRPALVRALRRSWVLAAVAALALAFGGWTTVAAQDSIPGDTLYPVKRTQERVLLVVVFTQDRKAELHVSLAEARTEEAAKLAALGNDPTVIDETTLRMQEHMLQAVTLMGGKLTVDGRGRFRGDRFPGMSGKFIPPPPEWLLKDKAPIDNATTAPAETEYVQPWRGSASARRAAMQQRFYHQFMQYQAMRQGLGPGLQAGHQDRVEQAISRSEALLLEAFLVMRELEYAQNAAP